MKAISRQLLREVGIYYAQAVAFAFLSYLLFILIYGGTRIPLFAWCLMMVSAATLPYIPVMVRMVRYARRHRADGDPPPT